MIEISVVYYLINYVKFATKINIIVNYLYTDIRGIRT